MRLGDTVCRSSSNPNWEAILGSPQYSIHTHPPSHTHTPTHPHTHTPTLHLHTSPPPHPPPHHPTPIPPRPHSLPNLDQAVEGTDVAILPGFLSLEEVGSRLGQGGIGAGLRWDRDWGRAEVGSGLGQG